MKKYIILISILVFNFNSGNSQNFSKGNILSVCAQSGLNLREEPDINGKKIKLLEYGDELVVVKSSDIKAKIEINGISGNWIKVKSKDISGFVFDAYVTRLPTLNLQEVDSYYCVIESLKKYALEDIGLIDSVFYSNCLDGEGTNNMTIFDLANGHQFIKHGYWEGSEIEFQLKNISDNEAITLLKLILSKCGELSEEDLINLNKIQVYGINNEQYCSSFRIRRFANTIIIRRTVKL